MLVLLKIVAIMFKLIMLFSVEIAECCVREPCPAPVHTGWQETLPWSFRKAVISMERKDQLLFENVNAKGLI